jgi:hypothetical protein
MLMVRPSMDFICLTFALFQLGAVVILIDPGMGYKNLLRCIGSVRPDMLVGIPKAILFSRIFRSPFATVRKRIRVGRLWGVGHGLEPVYRLMTRKRLLFRRDKRSGRHHFHHRIHWSPQGRGVHARYLSHPIATHS